MSNLKQNYRKSSLDEIRSDAAKSARCLLGVIAFKKLDQGEIETEVLRALRNTTSTIIAPEIRTIWGEFVIREINSLMFHNLQLNRVQRPISN
jgi:hypothetical protein